MTQRLIGIIPGTERRGRCKDCHQPFTWITVASEGRGRPARWMPFDGMPFVISQSTDEKTRVTVAMVSRASLHNCPEHRKAVERRQAPVRRRREESRTGQGRFF